MHRTIILISVVFLFSFSCNSQNNDFQDVMKEFVQVYKELHLPDFKIDYKENLKSIQSLSLVQKQEEAFLKLADKIKGIDRYSLSKKDRISFELMRYQINLNVERIYLEKRWLKDPSVPIPENGVYDISIGKDWYRYLLHYWVDREASPEKLFEFGELEVEKIKNKISAIQQKSGLDEVEFNKHINTSNFFYKDPEDIQAAFKAKKEQVSKILPTYFPFMKNLPAHTIKRYTEESDIQTPAFYRAYEKTFYYNYFNRPFNKRQIAWIYLHEANPGHHYQIQLKKTLERSPIQELFNYSGYREGWAAYIEELGTEIGAYENIYDELGKWEWDLIRSVRVVLDIGMNYYGWNNDRAMEYWKKHIKDQDDIAKREIKRMRNWPAQVITYKYGADKILKWRTLLEKKPNFNLKEFHRLVLENGDIPFSVLEPFILSDGLTVINNISYVNKENIEVDSLQRLNLVLPKNKIKPPLLLWIGSGAWALVDRHREMNFVKRIAREDIAVASVGHRLSSAVFQNPLRTTGVKHPEHIKDIATAFRWLYDHADEYGYDKERIYVGGYSSGAHLAALLSLDNRYLQNVGLDKSNIKGVIPISGTYDIPDYKNAFANGSRPELVEQHVNAVFGDTEAEHLNASPTTFINEMSVPMLLISDSNMIGYTNVFEEKIIETEFQAVTFLYIRNKNHRELYDDIANGAESSCRNFIVDFIK
ncbi:DUF885 family protein [uncultured Lacinutrix sp.]|uniref:DUF885 family protein n=1 Tax=uncultured Lacinutrix sp. TaxID=574032 RepID=UPI0026186621|nr:DUF885 family protein [uncultured Lacinutrix sp.]